MTSWRKSSYSGPNGSVEVAVEHRAVILRNSHDPQGPRLTFTTDEWTAFLAGVAAGEFDFEEGEQQ